MADAFGNWTVQLRKGVLELGVLNLLNRKDHYGYELFTVMKDQLGLLVGFGTLYPVLRRLENTGLVSARLSDSRLGPDRKYYSLTAAGRREVKRMNCHFATVSRRLQSLVTTRPAP